MTGPAICFSEEAVSDRVSASLKLLSNKAFSAVLEEDVAGGDESAEQAT